MKTRHALPLAALALLGCVTLALPAHAQPVHGFVDLHSHLMAEHSFGGGWYSGRAEGPMHSAVERCDGNVLGSTHAAVRIPAVATFFNEDTGWHPFTRRGYDTRRCQKAFGFINIPGTCPQEHFENWPKWNSLAHQQMWQGWLQQAHQGGLRIMVASLAESNFLCTLTEQHTRRYGCDEMESIRRQLFMLRVFASANSGWVELATSPAHARRIIHAGKLAIVPSVEVTQLFPSGDFLAQLDELRALGVRSVQVVHHANNRFGGAAPMSDLLLAANVAEATLSGVSTQINDNICRDSAGARGDCDGDTYLNEKGLTADGVTLVNAMMDRGMLLDVAHLSRRAFARTYTLAQPRGYPLLYSHTHMWDEIDSSENRHEKYLQPGEYHMIQNEGGMIGLRTGNEDTRSRSNVWPPNTCPGSTASFAQSLRAAVDSNLKVGFGADFNGFAKQVRPRWGTLLAPCHVDQAQINATGGANEFHKKGLAHVGMLPALVADMARMGLPASYINQLNSSAENFLLLWEKSVSRASNAHSNWARQATVTASSTFCTPWGPDHCYSPERVNDGNRSTGLGGT